MDRVDYEAEFTDVVAPLPRSGVTRRYATATADRDRLAALVDHYERHLAATGRHWVITEAHRRANTHPNPEETAP